MTDKTADVARITVRFMTFPSSYIVWVASESAGVQCVARSPFRGDHLAAPAWHAAAPCGAAAGQSMARMPSAVRVPVVSMPLSRMPLSV